jgi:hypothetical protein
MANIKELESALIKADKLAQAGDAQARQDARIIAGEIRRLTGPQTEPQPADVPPTGPRPSPTLPIQGDEDGRVQTGPFSTARADTVDNFGRPMSWRQAQPAGIRSIPNRLRSAFAGAFQGALTFDDQRLMRVIERSHPGVQFEQDENGHVIADFSAIGGGRGYLNPPGMDQGDMQRVAVAAAQFAPGASLASQLGGGILRQGLAQGAAAGLTEVARDIGSQIGGGTDEVSATNLDVGTIGVTAGFGALAPAIGSALSKVLAKSVPGRQVKVLNSDGTLSDDALRMISESADPAAVSRSVAAQLVDDGVLTPEQAKTFNLFRSQGVNPTRANLTQTADDWQLQQSSIKNSGPLRTAVDQQDVALASRGQQLADATGGTPGDLYSTGQSIHSAVSRRALDEDQMINGLYRMARDRASDSSVVGVNSTVTKLREVAQQDTLSGGAVSAIKGELQRRGLMNNKWRPQGRMTVEQAEEIRQVMNQFYGNTQNPQAREVIKTLKSALDDDVFRATGDDLFKEARAARAQFSRNIERSRVNKFDKSQKSLVQDILDNKINPEQVFERVVVQRGYGVDDLRGLRNYLTNGTPEQVAQGQQALNDMRRQAIDFMFDRATSGAGRTEVGVAFNGTGFRKAMDQIGSRKLEVLFTPDEMRSLAAVRSITEARIPVTMTQQGRGPTEVAMEALQRELPGPISKIQNLFRVRSLYRDFSRQAAAADPARETVQAFDRAARVTMPQAQTVTQGFRGLLD